MGWVALLSNGETARETRLTRPGEFSEWQALLTRLETDNLRIVGLALVHPRGNVQCISGADGYFQGYQLRTDLYGGHEQMRQGVGSVFEKLGLVFINWMDAFGNIYPEVAPLGGLLVHTTLRTRRDLIHRP